jgi:hypothetical protein
MIYNFLKIFSKGRQMKKLLLSLFALFALSWELHADYNVGFYIETKFNAAENRDKMIGKTQSAKELVGERKSINEFDLGFYTQSGALRGNIYGSLWFGNAHMYGAGFGIEGKYKPFESIPVAFILGFDEKIGIGRDVFEQRNVTISAVNGGAPTMIYLEDDTVFDSTALKLGLEFEISKHFAINIAYVPRWDNYNMKYKEVGSPFFRRKREISWHEFQNSVMAGAVIYF